MGVIQNPDMGAASVGTPNIIAEAATAQLTVSAAGSTSLPVTPSNAVLVSGTLTTLGNFVQVAYNGIFTNNDSVNPVTIIWRVTYQGVNVLDSGSITIPAGGVTGIAKQTTFQSSNMTGLFAFIANYVSGPTSAPSATYTDLSATELRR